MYKNNKPIILEGITYKTLKEACDYYNLNYNMVYSRLERGWSIEEAFGLVKRYNNRNKPVTLEDVTYISVAEACRYYNLDYKTVSGRLNIGWSIEEAFELVERNNTYKSNACKPVTLEDVTYISVAEACRYYNLNYKIISSRLKLGWSIEEAFGLVERINTYKSNACKPITLEGKTFKSIKEACEYYNLNYSKVKGRLDRGWDIEEIFELVPRNNTCEPIIVAGKTFNSVKEACNYYNKDYRLIVNRLNNRWSMEEAFELVERNNKKTIIPITIDGKTFNSVKEACDYYGTSVALVHSRINTAGWDIIDAILTPVLCEYNGKQIIVNSNHFISIAEACRYYNLDYYKISSRLRCGWSIEEAFELVERNDNCKPITVEDKTYSSIKEASKCYNLKYNIIHSRLSNNWSIEEAFELVPRKRNK